MPGADRLELVSLCPLGHWAGACAARASAHTSAGHRLGLSPPRATQALPSGPVSSGHPCSPSHHPPCPPLRCVQALPVGWVGLQTASGASLVPPGCVTPWGHLGSALDPTGTHSLETDCRISSFSMSFPRCWGEPEPRPRAARSQRLSVSLLGSDTPGMELPPGTGRSREWAHC